jgi:hypothetical protein
MELDIGTKLRVINNSAIYNNYSNFISLFPNKDYKDRWKPNVFPRKKDIVTVVDKHEHLSYAKTLYIVEDNERRLFIIDMEDKGDFVVVSITPEEFYKAIKGT